MIKRTSWRFIDTGIKSPHWNMALDEALLNGFKEGDLPILRLYGWENALSLGKFSNIHRCVDILKLEEQKLPIVRRMSGGGVLVHGGDLSYTMILPHKSLQESGVKENYRYLCGFLIRLYENLGYNACFAHDSQQNELRSDICLAGTEAYDILIKGNKMGGNAQRYARHLLFQHGTIPMKVDESLFEPLFLIESGLKHAQTLQRLGTRMTYETLSLLLRDAFCESFHADLIDKPLNHSEAESAQELLVNKYSQERWNFHAKCIYP